LIGNKHKLTKKVMEDIAALELGALQVWQEESGWVSHKLMKELLETLSGALGRHRHTRQIILVLDCARCHISKEITNKANSLGIWLCFVPARLTWLLQPLDIMAFRSFKSRFRIIYTQKRCKKLGGVLSTLEWIQIVAEAVKNIFAESDWSRAFHCSGLTNEQRHVSEWIRAHVNMDCRRYTARALTMNEMQSLGGRRIRMPWIQLLRAPLGVAHGTPSSSQCMRSTHPALAWVTTPEEPVTSTGSPPLAAGHSGSRPADAATQQWRSTIPSRRRLPVGTRLGPASDPSAIPMSSQDMEGQNRQTRPWTRSQSSQALLQSPQKGRV